jgi:hypothetical protein
MERERDPSKEGGLPLGTQASVPLTRQTVASQTPCSGISCPQHHFVRSLLSGQCARVEIRPVWPWEPLSGGFPVPWAVTRPLSCCDFCLWLCLFSGGLGSVLCALSMIWDANGPFHPIPQRPDKMLGGIIDLTESELEVESLPSQAAVMVRSQGRTHALRPLCLMLPLQERPRFRTPGDRKRAFISPGLRSKRSSPEVFSVHSESEVRRKSRYRCLKAAQSRLSCCSGRG